jgi:ribonuclease P protein component
MNFSFGKEYKLCSHNQIDSLFKEGKKVKEYPLTVIYTYTEIEIPKSFQLLISVPKRLFKKAHDRNYIKRCIREVVRKNKQELETELETNNKKLIFAIVYTSKEQLAFSVLEQKLVKAIGKLTLQINQNDKN